MELYSTLTILFVVLTIPFLRKSFFHREKMENIQKEISKKRLPYFDFLKGISILVVIWIHCIYVQILTIPNGHENTLNFFNNILRFTIPFFFMISGILLNPEEKNWKQFYTKKLARIIIPYILCVLTIGIFKEMPIKNIFFGFFTGRLAIPYYFILVLFQMYLLYPLFLKWKKSVWFLPLILGISVCSFLIPQTWLFFGIPTSFQYLFFFAYGIVKRESFLSYNAQKKDLFSWITMICIYFVLLFVYPAYYYNTQYVYGPAMLHLAFIFQKQFHIQNKIGKYIESLGQNSLWIFLTHYLVVLLTYRLFQNTLHNYWGNFLFLMFIATVSSITFAYIIEKIYSFAQKKLLP